MAEHRPIFKNKQKYAPVFVSYPKQKKLPISGILFMCSVYPFVHKRSPSFYPSGVKPEPLAVKPGAAPFSAALIDAVSGIRLIDNSRANGLRS